MKVLLVNVGIAPEWVPPLGLASLNAYLRERGHDVAIADLATRVRLFRLGCEQALSRLQLDHSLNMIRPAPGTQERALIDTAVERLASAVLEFNADVVGFSVNFKNFPLSLLVAKCLRGEGQGPQLVWGGPQCHHMLAGDFLAHSGVADFIVHGEGEEALVQLLDGLKGRGRCRGLAGVTSCNDGTAERGPERAPISDLSVLPCPDFAGLDLSSYSGEPTLPLCASRGCLHRCAFCNVRRLWGKVRSRPPGLVASDLRRLVEGHDVRSFRFNDSLLNITPAAAAQLSRAVLEASLDISWSVNAYPFPFRPGETKLLAAAGCKGLEFGVESPIPRLAREMRKHVPPTTLRDLLGSVKLSGIAVSIGMIVGWPSETRAEFLRSLVWLYRNRDVVDHVSVHRTVVTPGAELAEHPERFGITLGGPTPAEELCSVGTIPWRSALVSPPELQTRFLTLNILAEALLGGNHSPNKERIRVYVPTTGQGQVLASVEELAGREDCLDHATAVEEWYTQVTKWVLKPAP